MDALNVFEVASDEQISLSREIKALRVSMGGCRSVYESLEYSLNHISPDTKSWYLRKAELCRAGMEWTLESLKFSETVLELLKHNYERSMEEDIPPFFSGNDVLKLTRRVKMLKSRNTQFSIEYLRNRVESLKH